MTSQPDQLSNSSSMTGEHARPEPGASGEEARSLTLGARTEPPPMSDEMHAQMDAAMEAAMSVPEEKPQPKAGHGVHPGHAPQEGHKPAAIRGPRVVQAGREMRPGTVVSVGPTDVFIEFGPKELGVVPRIQWTEGQEPPKVGEKLEVVVDHFEAGESLFICSRPGLVRKADWEMLE